MTEPETPPQTPPKEPPPREPGLPVTTGFIGFLIVIYLLTSYPGFGHIQRWALYLGGMIPGNVESGEYWRLITANLLHENPPHLLLNSFALFIFGRMIEPILGGRRLLLLYLFSGLGCALASAAFVDGLSLGASGIAYGLMGFYFVVILFIRKRTQPEAFGRTLRGMILAIIIYVAYDMMRPDIDIAGHMGGLAGGVAYALLLLGGRGKMAA